MAALLCMAGRLLTGGRTRTRLLVAPTSAAHGTGLPFTGSAAAHVTAQVTLLSGAGYITAPGTLSRGAPV